MLLLTISGLFNQCSSDGKDRIGDLSGSFRMFLDAPSYKACAQISIGLETNHIILFFSSLLYLHGLKYRGYLNLLEL